MNLWKCKGKKELLIVLIMAFILFFFAVYKLPETKQPIIYGDEFGYWSNSSFFLGQDWSAAASSNNYYSYGYSLLLIPIRLLARAAGWNHWQMFQAAVIMHAVMLVGSFLLARRLCIRYLKDWHWSVRNFACFVAMLYPSYIVYSHLTLTEAALTFLFWVYLYVMMRAIDKPASGNHICFAVVSFYMYTVHQRCIAIVIASAIVVVYLKLQNRNRLKQVAVFWGVLCIGSIVHQCIKCKLQNDLYLANTPITWGEAFRFVWNKKTLLIVLMAAACLLVLYLMDRCRTDIRKSRIVFLACVCVAVALCIYCVLNLQKLWNISETADIRLATNDFKGQVSKILRVFTPSGIRQLFVSIVGKWFYLATASGLVLCFALLELGKQFASVVQNGVKQVWRVIMSAKEIVGTKGLSEEHVIQEKNAQRKEVQKKEAGRKEAQKQEIQQKAIEKDAAEDIWYFGVFLTWLGMFGVCVLYMIDIWRVDNLVYGRYHEAAAGFLFIYGFYILVHDKKWIYHIGLFIVAYLSAAWLCQHVLDGAGKDSFQIVHSIMLGRVFQDNEIPYHRVWESSVYAIVAAVAICVFVKVQVPKQDKKFARTELIRQCAALFGAACIWGYIGIATIEDYVIPVNKNIERSMPIVAEWIEKLSSGDEKIYYLRDTSGFRMGLILQFYLSEQQVTITTTQNMRPEEEAFYVASVEYGSRNEVREHFFPIVETPDFILLVPNNGRLFEQFLVIC